MEECIFCKIINQEIESEKVLENDNFIVIKDANPKVEGHSLVIPKKHFTNLIDMPASLYGELLETAQQAAIKLLKEYEAEGFNLIMNNNKSAGQLVEHAHLHILPRKQGDNFSVNV
ncbi:MAG: HIT family protein [Candidatus Nanoarchaeia archaeon]